MHACLTLLPSRMMKVEKHTEGGMEAFSTLHYIRGIRHLHNMYAQLSPDHDCSELASHVRSRSTVTRSKLCPCSRQVLQDPLHLHRLLRKVPAISSILQHAPATSRLKGYLITTAHPHYSR